MNTIVTCRRLANHSGNDGLSRSCQNTEAAVARVAKKSAWASPAVAAEDRDAFLVEEVADGALVAFLEPSVSPQKTASVWGEFPAAGHARRRFCKC